MDVALYSKLLRAIQHTYRTDYLCAGIVSAWIPAEDKFYASVCRYKDLNGKEVICSEKHDNLQQLYLTLTKNWLSVLKNGGVIIDPVDDLLCHLKLMGQ